MSTTKQSGAVSLFVVVFAMLLITIVTVSFLRLMIGDLRQATNNDLSQSAYDSAMAGTEDAKRALLYYQRQCLADVAGCSDLASKISSKQCNAGLATSGIIRDEDWAGGTDGRPGEVKVQQSSTNDQIFDQAYTCVTIELNTMNVEGEIENGASKIIPLKGESAFSKVQVSWYSQEDLSSPSATIDRPTQTASPLPLGAQTASGWPTTRPPVLRTQLMQVGSEFTLSDFDTTSGSNQSNANTLFLYPTRNGSSATTFMGNDNRKTSSTDNPDADTANSSPLATACLPSVSGGGYACSMTLTLPDPIDGDASTRSAFLHLLPYYKSTHFEVRLFDSADRPVAFEGVQPLIDSTGRANDLFRRVQSRVELTDPTFPYPQAAVDVTTEFCKDFAVTDKAPLIEATCRYN